MQANNTGQLDNTTELTSRVHVVESAENLPHARAKRARTELFLAKAERKRKAQEAERQRQRHAEEEEARKLLDLRLAEAEAKAKEESDRKAKEEKEIQRLRDMERKEIEEREREFEAAQLKLKEAKALRNLEEKRSQVDSLDESISKHIPPIDVMNERTSGMTSDNHKSLEGSKRGGDVDISGLDYSDTWFMTDSVSKHDCEESVNDLVGKENEDESMLDMKGTQQLEIQDEEDDIPDNTACMDKHTMKRDASAADIVEEDENLPLYKESNDMVDEKLEAKGDDYLSKIEEIVDEEYEGSSQVNSQDLDDDEVVSLTDTQEQAITNEVAALKIDQYKNFISESNEDKLEDCTEQGDLDKGYKQQCELVKSIESDAFQDQFGSIVAYWHMLTEEWTDVKMSTSDQGESERPDILSKAAVHFLLSLGISDEYQQQVESILRSVHGEILMIYVYFCCAR